MRRPLNCLLLTIALLFSTLAVSAAVSFQKEDQWTKWTKKEAEKMLSDSPWSQGQTETDTSEMFFSPTSDPSKPGNRSTSNDEARLSQGATNQAVNVKYFVRFFSARPVRRASVEVRVQVAPASSER